MIRDFDVHVTVHRDKFLIVKPTRCINFSNLFLKWNSTCFGQFLCPSSGVCHCTHSNGICHTGLLTACEQDQDGTADPVWHIPLLCVQWKTSDDGQRNCPKHVQFYFKNTSEKLMHLVCFSIRNETWSSCLGCWCQIFIFICFFVCFFIFIFLFFFLFFYFFYIPVLLSVSITRRLHTSNRKLSFYILLSLRSDLTKCLSSNILQ
jgi:hypothetical protein